MHNDDENYDDSINELSKLQQPSKKPSTKSTTADDPKTDNETSKVKIDLSSKQNQSTKNNQEKQQNFFQLKKLKSKNVINLEQIFNFNKIKTKKNCENFNKIKNSKTKNFNGFVERYETKCSEFLSLKPLTENLHHHDENHHYKNESFIFSIQKQIQLNDVKIRGDGEENFNYKQSDGITTCVNVGENLGDYDDQKKKKWWPFKVPWIILLISLMQISIYYTFLDDRKFFIKFQFSPGKKYEIWRFITYPFLHLDSIHMWINIIIQIFIASPLESEQGHLRVLLIYFGGVIAGPLGSAVFTPKLKVVGASAGVYSLLMSHIPHIALNYSRLHYPKFRLLSVFFLFSSDAVHTVLHIVIKHNKGPIISFGAHISGALAGIFIGFLVFRGSTSIFFRLMKYFSLIVCLCWIALALNN